VGTLVLLAFPPSPLFISEVKIFSEIVSVKMWWLLIVMLVLMCVVLYSIWSRSLRLSYHSNQDELHLSAVNRRLSYIASLPLVAAIVLGLWQPKVLNDAIENIISDGVEVSAEVTLEEVEVLVSAEEPEAVAEDAEPVEAVMEASEEQVIEETTDENLDNNGDVL
jgi:formate hydrogenlyase subunit 3/multisubunit Na+/H+ antiporter MnhD subunit